MMPVWDMPNNTCGLSLLSHVNQTSDVVVVIKTLIKSSAKVFKTVPKAVMRQSVMTSLSADRLQSYSY